MADVDFSLVLVSIEKTYQISRQCMTAFPNTSNFVKNASLRVVLSTLFRPVGDLVKLFKASKSSFKLYF